MKNWYRNQKGSMTVYAVVTIFCFIFILTGIFLSSSSIRKGQLKTIVQIAKAYQKDNDEVEEIYIERKSQDTFSTVEQAVSMDYKFTRTETLVDSNRDKITIPAGFKIVKGGIDDIEYENPQSPTVKDGIVITDDSGNEFVWIPITSDLKVLGTEKTMAKESTAEGYKATDGEINYEGVLYNFAENNSTAMLSSENGQGTQGYREPDGGVWNDGDQNELKRIQEILSDQADRYTDENALKNTMQEDYNEMINSVKKYGGFYVGRYEMGIGVGTNGEKAAISKAGEPTHSGNWNDSSQQWYGLYAYGKTFTNTENSVKSSMIWGSQYDAMLNYALTGNDKDKVTAIDNGYRGGNLINTGATKNDKILNIFDLAGNYGEWTLEAYIGFRIMRGGRYNTSGDSPSYRHQDYDTYSTIGQDSTRLTLYIQ